MKHADRTRSRRGTAVATAVAVAVAVAGVVVGIAGAASLGSTADPGPRASARLSHGSPSPSSGDPSTVDLDLGPVSTSDVAGCLTKGFAADPAEVTVAYGVEQRTVTGTVPVLILRNRAGQVRLCDQSGRDSPATSPAPTATERRPVAFYSTGRRDWSCTSGDRLRRFTLTEWLSTAPSVDTVRVRFLVDGTPGPWFRTRAVGGFAHLAAWLDGPLSRGTRITLQHQVLDAAGGPVAQRALPSVQRLDGCSGGSAQIG